MRNGTLIAVLAALLLSGCATTNAPFDAIGSVSPEDARLEKVNATVDTSAVAASADAPGLTIPLLAIEVEVTADSVTPVSATIINAPPKPNSAIGDLRVQAIGTDWSYTMPDPRLVETSDPAEPGTAELESARGHVYVPLLVAVTGISIQPSAELMVEKVSRGGTFDIGTLAAQACMRAQSQLPVCQQIIEKFTREP